MKKSLAIILLLVPLWANAYDDSMSPEAIAERTKPVGEVKVSETSAVATAAKPATEAKPAEKVSAGEATYKQFCSTCHANGLAGAPKAGTADWEPRVKKGFEVLLDHAKNGFNAMPPKGTCSTCSDDDLKSAIKFMSEKKSLS